MNNNFKMPESGSEKHIRVYSLKSWLISNTSTTPGLQSLLIRKSSKASLCLYWILLYCETENLKRSYSGTDYLTHSLIRNDADICVRKHKTQKL